MSYYKKYIKYKIKYLQYKNLSGGKLLNLNINDLKISEYKKDSLITKINQNELNEFYNFVNKFNAKNSKVHFNSEQADKDFKKGILNVTTKENIDYKLKVIPIIQINYTQKILCWSWVNSFVRGVQSYNNMITKFRKNIRKYMDELNYLDFDCIDYNSNQQKFDDIMYDIILISQHILNAKGYIEFAYSNSNNDDIVEYFYITDIMQTTKLKFSSDQIYP